MGDLIAGTSDAAKELQLQRREDARDGALAGLLGLGSSSGGSGNTAAAQIQAYGLGSGELLAASGYPAGVRSTDTFDGGPGVPYDRQSTIYNAEAGVVGYSVKFPEIEIRPLASNTNSFETASYDINGNATGYSEQIQLNGSSTTYLKSLSNIYRFLTDPLIGTAEQIVQNPGVSLGYLYDGVVGYGKGAINVIPETGTFIYKGYRFLGAGIGEATGLLNPGALGRTIDGLEDTTGRVLNYNSYSEQIGGFTGAATSPALAFRAASVTASAYRTYAADAGQFGEFGQFPISDGPSARVNFGALDTIPAQSTAPITKGSTSSAIQTYYPPNRGFFGSPNPQDLSSGYQFDRYGGFFDESGNFKDFGTFVAPANTPYGMRALPPGTDLRPFTTYEVIKPISGVPSGPAAPYFGELGLGTQHELRLPIQDYLDQGYIRIIKQAVPKKN